MPDPQTYKTSLRQDTALGHKAMDGEDARVSATRTAQRVTTTKRSIFGEGTNPKGQGASTTKRGPGR